MNSKKILIEQIMEIKKISKNQVAIIHNELLKAARDYTIDEIRLMDTLISFIQPEDKDLKK